jgi:hypothetical protein
LLKPSGVNSFSTADFMERVFPVSHSLVDSAGEFAFFDHRPFNG